MIKRLLSGLLALVMLCTLLPTAALAADEEVYTITNGYLTYSINSKSGGFSIKTQEGNPQKSKDNDMPLLYREALGTQETSFVTVRIDGEDYIFGRDYGFFGLASTLHEPVVSNEGRLLEVEWEIKGYSITQRVALSLDKDNDLTGNVGISYVVKNNSGQAGNVGVRLLLDTALGNEVDAPYVTADAAMAPLITETEFAGASLPTQLRATDSLADPGKMSYLFLKGWNAEGETPDKLIVGHWANIANTYYDYAADTYCDFTNYSNKHRVPDSAYAAYWSEKALDNGATRSLELLYGVGNFSSQTLGGKIGLDLSVGKVTAATNKKSYQNNGVFQVVVNLDNAVDGAANLASVVVQLTADEGLTVQGDDTVRYTTINVGETKKVTFNVKATNQSEITSKRVYATVNAVETATTNTLATSASRYVLLPGLSGSYAEVQVNSVNPKTVYTDGDKAVTLSGDMKPLSALAGTDGWDLYLEHTTSNLAVRVEKKDIAFLDNDCQNLSFTTRETLAIGTYNIVFRFRDSALTSNLGLSSLTVGEQLEVSADPQYKLRSYGLAALVRHSTSEYKLLNFNTESEYRKFFAGELTVDGIRHDFSAFNTSTAEVLLVVRGKIREMKDENQKIYYQASPGDGDITINNILTYTGDQPLTLRIEDPSIRISGDGLVKVINSIDVWKGPWYFEARKGALYTLNAEETNQGHALPLTLKLGGAAVMIQSIGGFLIDLKFGEMNAEYVESLGAVYGISFGGSISIPIKNPEKKKEDPQQTAQLTDDQEDYSDAFHDLFDERTEPSAQEVTATGKTESEKFKKDTNFSDGNLSANIDEIRYGQQTEKKEGVTTVTGTGFVGVNTTVSLALPKDILGSLVQNAPGVYASFTINTIANEYKLHAGLNIKVIECEGTLSLKETTVGNKEVIVPDEISFYIREGLKIPIAPPLFMTGLGGGIQNLADTIGGEFDTLPPITLLLFTRLELIESLIGDFNAELGLEGLKLTGDMQIKRVAGLMNVQAGISARWIDPWHLSMYGKINVIDGLLTGTLSVTIADGLFYGYIGASVCIPNSVPLLGGMELGGVEAAVSNEYIGANVKIIGLKMGIVIYWDGNYDFGSGIDLTPPQLPKGRAAMMQMSEDGGEEGTAYTALFGTNVHRLDTGAPMRPKGRAAGSTITKTVDPSNEDALLLEIPYNGYLLPRVTDVTLTGPKGAVALTPDDGHGGGNFVVQQRDGKGYIYISITDKSKLDSGDWTVTLLNGFTIDDFGANGVNSLPSLQSVSYTRDSAKNMELDVSWAVDKEYNAAGTVDLYLTENPNAITQVQNATQGVENAFGINVAHETLTKIAGGSKSGILLPESFPSGKYYVVAVISSPDCGVTTAISNAAFDFVNPNLPKPIKSAAIIYAGDGALSVKVEDADGPDYTHYLVNLVAENGDAVENSFAQFTKGGSIVIGQTTALVPGSKYRVEVSTLREQDGKFFYGVEQVASAPFEMPQLKKPVLTSVTTNQSSGTSANGELTLTYTFAEPVALVLNINGQEIFDNSRLDSNDKSSVFQTTWSYTRQLPDGEYLIDFTAFAKSKDTLTGGEAVKTVSNAQLTLNVDTQSPVLTLRQEAAKSVAQVASNATLSGVAYADKNGKYTIAGLTEVDATLTADGKTDGVTVAADGSFTVTGTKAATVLTQSVVLAATDKAGNKATLTVPVVNANATGYTGLELRANGTEIKKNDAGERELRLNNGSASQLSVYGVLVDGKKVLIDEGQITWSVLGDKNIVTLNEGEIKGAQMGTTALKATVGQVQAVTKDSAAVSLGTEEYIVVAVGDFPEPPTPGPSGGGGSTSYYSITITPTEHGKVAVSNAKVTAGTSVTVTITPDKGYEIDKVLVNAKEVAAKKLFTIATVKEDTVITVTFKVEETVDTWVNPFTDIKKGDWYYESVFYVFKNKLLTGVSDTRFAPEVTTTRGMMATILYRMAGEPETTQPIAFTDVADGMWYSKAVQWAAQAGLAQGYDGLFRPDEEVTREQIALFLYRYARYQKAYMGRTDSLERFADAAGLSPWAKEAVSWAVDIGVMNGKDGGLLDGQGKATRAETAVMIKRFLTIDEPGQG